MNIPNFNYTINAQGERVYEDPNVQLVYVNLRRLSNFVGACQVKAELEYAYVCQNVNADGNTDTSRDFLINLLVGAFEFMGDVGFPWAGKAGGKVAGWLLSALIDSWRSAPPPSLISDFDNVWNGTKQAYDEAKLVLDGWCEKLGPDVWTEKHVSPDGSTVITVSQLAGVGYLPDSQTTEFDQGAIAVANQSRYLMNRILVPTRWKYIQTDSDDWWNCYYTRWNASYEFKGPFYKGLSIQTMFGIRTSFPDIDIVETEESYSHCVYFSKEDVEDYEHKWFSDDLLYKGTKYRHWELRNAEDNGTAPESLIGYLFTDGPGGKSTGIASRDDVFQNWGMHH
jgi:hypothetical protein